MNKIKFNELVKIKRWDLRPGIYRCVLEAVDILENRTTVMRYMVLCIDDEYYEYYVRHCYRAEDEWKLKAHLIGWLGMYQFQTAMEEEYFDLEKLIGREAMVQVNCLSKRNQKEPLRVIDGISPVEPLKELAKMSVIDCLGEI
jgi:hypothetical protein